MAKKLYESLSVKMHIVSIIMFIVTRLEIKIYYLASCQTEIFHHSPYKKKDADFIVAIQFVKIKIKA